MSVITGLAKIKEELAKRPSGGDFEEKDPARWLSIPAGGDPVKTTFMNELDEGSPNYSEKRGLAVLSIQHSGVPDWKKNAACTADEGDCYGCAQGWKQKYVLYFNVVVDNGKEDPYVAIFSRGLGKGSVAQALVDMAADEDFEYSITDKTFKFSRTGTTKDDTTYSLSPLPKKVAYKEVVDAKGNKVKLEDAELFDLKKYVFTVAPERQEKYYTGSEGGGEAETRKAPVTATDINKQW